MYNKWRYVACRPTCSCCPEAEKIITVEGKVMVQITDDYNSSVIMKPEEMLLLSNAFIKAYEEGKFCESN